MITLKGIHATIAYHAKNINKNGFIVPQENSGKAGSGLYFWNYESNRKNALELSKQWWDFALNKANIYDRKQDCSLVQFDCEIHIPEEELLDFVGDIALYEAFLDAYPIGLYDEATYGAKLDDFINVLERISDQQFSVCRMNLSVPNLRKVPFANAFPAFIIKKPIDIFIKECLNS